MIDAMAGRNDRLGWAMAVIAVVGLTVLVAIWVFPMTVHGGGWPTGTIRYEKELVGDPALFRDIVAAKNSNRWIGFDIRTGDQLWQSKRCIGPKAAGLSGNEDAAPTTIQEGSILVIRCSGDVHGLDLRTGAIRWSYDPGQKWTMLRLGGGRIVLALDDHADVVDIETGELLFSWKGEHVDEHALIVTANDDGVFIGEDDQLIALDPDGEERWRAEWGMDTFWATGDLVLLRIGDGVLSFDVETGDIVGDYGTSSKTLDTRYLAQDRDVVVLGGIDQGGGVGGYDIERYGLRWHRPGTDFLAAGPRYVAVGAAGECQILRISTGDPVGRCSEPRWITTGVDLDLDRVAVTATSPLREGSTIVVRRV